MAAFNHLHLPAYGYAIAKELASDGSHKLISHGMLYRALDRSIDRGLLEARWQTDPDRVERPPRRVYRITPSGSVVVSEGSLRSEPQSVAAWLSPRV
ncbi:Transcriptional regulator PadR-like family protein [Herbiconiux ginsengi]|uniref:Transcriptional regulator PadR-like family protein n=1 Tax=Herbiconiux ginsengi TaxID=381665 RepID=A0A1H3PJ96_9MICO|nr:Transcriptional regulator PadR-like family protein [Herbiconiux ginsengi]